MQDIADIADISVIVDIADICSVRDVRYGHNACNDRDVHHVCNVHYVRNGQNVHDGRDVPMPVISAMSGMSASILPYFYLLRKKRFYKQRKGNIAKKFGNHCPNFKKTELCITVNLIHRRSECLHFGGYRESSGCEHQITNVREFRKCINCHRKYHNQITGYISGNKNL